MADPLAGFRKSIAEGKVKVLRWPADEECPVEKGQRYKIRGVEIEIESIKRKINKGQPAEWHVTFIRHEPDRVFLLRQAPPVHAGSEKDRDIDLNATERARRDGSYTSSRVSAVPHEPESVGPEWSDPNAAQREEWRRMARAQVEKERQDHHAKSRLLRLLAFAPPETHQQLLAGIIALCDEAEADMSQKVA